MPATNPLRILLVNDDGPPSASSPHILGFYRELRARGHDVSVVLPSSQKSWGAMAFSIAGEVGVWWYYPKKSQSVGAAHEDQQQQEGAWESKPRAVESGEEARWVLLDGSPTTCTTVGLNNQELLNPDLPTSRPFDLVLSGPNFGRNTGLAFCLSSGTLGAALAGALSGVKSIAVSYGHFQKVPAAIQTAIEEQKRSRSGADPAQSAALEEEEQQGSGQSPSPPHPAPSAPTQLVELAHRLTVDIVERLYAQWEDAVGVYGINVPLAWTLRDPKVYWTTMWKNAYPRLFGQSPREHSDAPSYLPHAAPPPQTRLTFQPQMAGMMAPQGQEVVGTDTWAIMNGHVSITRLQPGFTEVPASGSTGETADVEARRWRL